MLYTLDTDVVRDMWDDDSRRTSIDRLIGLAREGHIELSVTRHIHQDVPYGDLAERINGLPELGIRRLGGVFQLDVSTLDGPDGLGDAGFDDWWRVMESIRKPGDPKLPGSTDYLHLHAHHIGGRDRFLTWDKAILRMASLLERVFGIRVMTPQQALDEFCSTSNTAG